MVSRLEGEDMKGSGLDDAEEITGANRIKY